MGQRERFTSRNNMTQEYPDWIDEYGEAFYSSFQMHDVRVHMPFNGWDFYPLFANLWVRKMYETVKLFREKGLRVGDVIERLPNHGSMKFKFSEIIMCLGLAHTPPERARFICDFFVEAIRAQTAGEALWANNKIHAFEDVGKVIAYSRPVPADRAHASEIGKIITGCATLGHGLYNDFCVDISYDMYGPYDVSGVYGDGALMLIRSFDDLNPTELWPHHTPFPFKKIRVFGIYKNIILRPTFVTCQMISTGNMIDNLSHFQVIVDGRAVNSLDELKVVREAILKSASSLYVEYQGFSFEKHKEFWLSQLGYQLKNLFDIVGLDWHPSQEMVNRVKDKELVPTVETYDIPREEFYEKFGIEYLKQVYRSA